jgi:hypothetical protein
VISPSTPPGTKIVCINTSDIRLQHMSSVWIHTARDLVLGAEYTLREISPVYTINPLTGHREMVPYLWGVTIEETDGRYISQRFRRRDLPESLTRLQTALLKPAPALG